MFFTRKSGNGKQHRNAHINTLVGHGTVVDGNISFHDGLHIDGLVKGNVIAEGEAGMLTLSEKGRIEGEVHVHNIVLNGEVRGDVYASVHIELAAEAKVIGDVYYNLIEMAMGAEVNGKLVHQAGTPNGEATIDAASSEAIAEEDQPQNS